MSVKTGKELRVARHSRLRKKVVGTNERPRLAVYRSGNNIYAQVVDDSKMHTVAAASSVEKGFGKGHDLEAAKKVGKAIAERAKKAGVSAVVFDRGGFAYHGRIAAVAEAAREGGLEF